MHTYATVAEANDYLLTGGSTSLVSELVTLKLGILEAVSRRIDNVCHRSGFGSGFGPRTGVNYYDGDGSNVLWLKDDCLSLATLSIAATTGGTPVTATLTTDYYLSNADGYTGPPWRQVVLHQRGSPIIFGNGYRTISTPAASSWGYESRTATATATASAIGTTTTTSVTVSAGTEFSPGQTILIDTEQMYVRAVSGTTLTVTRGVNGTTAATHGAAAAIAIYAYDSRVNLVAKSLFTRRWKARDAGADGLDGGLDVPGLAPREGEDTIIRRGLADLLMLGTY